MYTALYIDVDPPADVLRIACSRAFASLVKVCWMMTRLSKSTISARSCAAEPPRESDGGLLRGRQAQLHAGAGVHEQRQGDRKVRPVEEDQVLLDAVLEDLEILWLEVRDVPRTLRHRDVERHDVDAGLEGGLRIGCASAGGVGAAGLLRRFAVAQAEPRPGRRRGPRRGSGVRARPAVGVTAVLPGVPRRPCPGPSGPASPPSTVTVSGGMSVSGRA